ncbi:hypothetical protein AOQ84DRAFT_391380 [Glonium stellatum]|uniref:PARG catalytic Macro domain-containing protein n=1 Tax=Glonium stellatum TaxID=574774 RepID=A0A8E2JPC9_9PEZI|nr:hypothetical protein AOQ84DRAFT_391380 [Glonium stellatum]
MIYQLPTNPSIASSDPLGICDDECPSQALVLQQLIENVVNDLPADLLLLPTLIEDIAYTVHANGRLDTSCLRHFLYTNKSDGTVDAAQNLLKAALSLPQLFPTNTIATLPFPSSAATYASYTGFQINSLLAHQFLGTLQQPPSNNWGLPCFTSWFAANPAHTQAVNGYIRTLLHHFTNGGYEKSDSFTFLTQRADLMPDPSQCDSIPRIQLCVVYEEFEPSSTPNDPSPFVLVAAHAQPGPGPTATHEERLQAASPALSTSAIFTPSIPLDCAVITSAFPVNASWKGHNRTARLDQLHPPDARPLRHYILADALALDEVEEEGSGALKDIQSGRIEREIRKLYAAFKGAIVMQEEVERQLNAPCVIEAAAWGCQAFGGNVVAKVACMMIAAGLTGVEVRLTLLENRAQEIDAVKQILAQNRTVSTLWSIVTNPKIRVCKSTAELKDFIILS